MPVSRRKILSAATGLYAVQGLVPALRAQNRQAPAGQRPNPKEVMAQHEWGEGKLKPGDAAPDFTLKEQNTGRSVTLSKFKGVKPVAIVFGSFT